MFGGLGYSPCGGGMESLFDQAARAFLDRRNVGAVLALRWNSVEALGPARAAALLRRLLDHNRRACGRPSPPDHVIRAVCGAY